MADELKIDVQLKGFDDPLLGFEDPLLGFDDPLVGYVAFDRFDDPLVGLEKFGAERLRAETRRTRDGLLQFAIDNRQSIFLRLEPSREVDAEKIVEAVARADVVHLQFGDDDRPTLQIIAKG